MRIIRVLSTDQELVERFLAVLGRGLIVAGRGRTARPGFFLFACNFIHEYLEPQYFKKEDVLLQALVDCGFPPDEGPVGGMRREYAKSRELSRILLEAAKAWQAGEESGRPEVVWATSEYSEIMHHHFDQLKRLIHPLLEQTVTPEGEEKMAEDLNRLAFQDPEGPDGSLEKYVKILQMLEEEVNEWEK